MKIITVLSCKKCPYYHHMHDGDVCKECNSWLPKDIKGVWRKCRLQNSDDKERAERLAKLQKED